MCSTRRVHRRAISRGCRSLDFVLPCPWKTGNRPEIAFQADFPCAILTSHVGFRSQHSALARIILPLVNDLLADRQAEQSSRLPYIPCHGKMGRERRVSRIRLVGAQALSGYVETNDASNSRMSDGAGEPVAEQSGLPGGSRPRETKVRRSPPARIP